MKLNEDEWLEYQNVMEDVVKRSRLDKSIFFDLRGNHDNFGVPVVGGSFDFFSKYSINGQLGRNKNVNSVTLQVSYPSRVGLSVIVMLSRLSFTVSKMVQLVTKYLASILRSAIEFDSNLPQDGVVGRVLFILEKDYLEP